jgi:hypothetical protein
MAIHDELFEAIIALVGRNGGFPSNAVPSQLKANAAGYPRTDFPTPRGDVFEGRQSRRGCSSAVRRSAIVRAKGLVERPIAAIGHR